MSAETSGSSTNSPPVARAIRDHDDVATFFDGCAPTYADQHGDAERLLRYRLGLLRRLVGLGASDRLLEVGCGTGIHLLALADEVEHAIGVDLSPAMIEVTRSRSATLGVDVELLVERAETLDSIEDASVDVVICVGALEHMLDQAAVCRSVHRVLRPGGRLGLLTLNGGSLWYRRLAPVLGIGTRQLSTDHYLRRDELVRLLRDAGFGTVETGCWTFIQRGDLPHPWPFVLGVFDRIGRTLGLGVLRGGLSARAVKTG